MFSSRMCDDIGTGSVNGHSFVTHFPEMLCPRGSNGNEDVGRVVW